MQTITKQKEGTENVFSVKKGEKRGALCKRGGSHMGECPEEASRSTSLGVSDSKAIRKERLIRKGERGGPRHFE